MECEAGSFDKFNSIEIVNDITGPAQCGFEIGDDRSFERIAKIVAHGKPIKVFVNDGLRLTGRVYVNDLPGSAAGTTLNVVVRDLLADAVFASADPKTRVEKTTIRDFLIALWRPLGVTVNDFIFNAALERDLMTGVPTRGGKAPADLEAIKADQAKINPPETIKEASDRHLRRHGLMLWSTPSGRLWVGSPDDRQRPLYRLISKRWPNGGGNNVRDFRATRDWTDVPSELRVFGGQGGKDILKASVKAFEAWLDVIDAGFYRPVWLVNEALPNQAQVDRAARREMATRSKRKDAWTFTVDNWTYWNGSYAVPWANNTTADLDVDAVGGPAGRHYIHRVSLRGDAQSARSATVELVAPGILEL